MFSIKYSHLISKAGSKEHDIFMEEVQRKERGPDLPKFHFLKDAWFQDRRLVSFALLHIQSIHSGRNYLPLKGRLMH